MNQINPSEDVSMKFSEKHPIYFTIITHSLTVLITVFATFGGQILVEKAKPQFNIKHKVTNSPSSRKGSSFETSVYIEIENSGSRSGTAVCTFAPEKGDKIVGLDYMKYSHVVTDITSKNSDTRKLKINLNKKDKIMVIAKIIGGFEYLKNSKNILKIDCQEK